MAAKQLRRRTGDGTFEGTSPIIARLLANRGIADTNAANLTLKELIPPSELKNSSETAVLVADAIREDQRILIVADFDADGATSCALMVHGLGALGAHQVDYLVPNRFDFGYGLTPEIVDVAVTMHPDMIITVDNGISSHAGVERANELGITTVITDHHLPPPTLPNADAILNPNQAGCEFKSKNLAGVGVAFYLLSAVRQSLAADNWFNDRDMPVLADYLDLVALGTIADVVPMDKNNRILVNEGLKRIRAGRCRPGIRALLTLSGKRLPVLTSQDLAFFVAPRLNAAGRLEDMSLGIECLLTASDDVAHELASRLDGINAERREIEFEMKQQAFQMLKTTPEINENVVGVCLFDESWHQGVVGIVASRVKDRMNRPVVAFAQSSDLELKGSARSISGFHIKDAFAAIDSAYPDLIDKFGGHAMAAGLTLSANKFDRFRSAFDDIARQWLREDDLTARVVTDGELTDTFSVSLGREISMAYPWGQGFPEPLFDGWFEIIAQRIVGGRHLKLKLRPIEGAELIEAIAFGQDSTIEGRERHMAYRLSVNEYRGLESIQLIIECLDLYE